MPEALPAHDAPIWDTHFDGPVVQTKRGDKSAVKTAIVQEESSRLSIPQGRLSRARGTIWSGSPSGAPICLVGLATAGAAGDTRVARGRLAVSWVTRGK